MPVQDLKLIRPMLSNLGDEAFMTLGGIRRDPRLIEILDCFWPECYVSEFTGKIIMAPHEVEVLEALYKMFGVPMTVADNSLEVLGRA